MGFVFWLLKSSAITLKKSLPITIPQLGVTDYVLHSIALQTIISEAGLDELEYMLDEGNLQRSGLDTRVFGTRYPQKQVPMLLRHLTALKVVGMV